jgi:hypothetical protein
VTTPIGDIPASSIPAARAYLLAQLTTQMAALDPAILVCLDGPGPDQPDDIVSVGDVRQTYSPESGVGSGGAGWLREDYTVTVTVSCYRGGDDAATVFGRARQLADLVVAVVRSDPSLGGAVDRARPATAEHTSGWTEDHSGRMADIELGFDCLNTI